MTVTDTPTTSCPAWCEARHPHDPEGHEATPVAVGAVLVHAVRLDPQGGEAAAGVGLILGGVESTLLTPDQARTLAAALTEAADQVVTP